MAVANPCASPRRGAFRCRRCDARHLKDSLVVALHLGAVKGSEVYPLVKRSVLPCSQDDIVFDCVQHGLEAA